MEDCVFCRIVKGKEEAKVVKETENLVVIHDINPQAAVHLLIIPKKHIKDISKIDDELWSEIKNVAVGIGRERSPSGYRLLHNAGDAATIGHMQVHFLADTTRYGES